MIYYDILYIDTGNTWITKNRVLCFTSKKQPSTEGRKEKKKMKKEIFTKEEIKEMDQMQERAKAKRLQEEKEKEEKITAKKKVIKKIRLKNNIIKMMLSLTFNAVYIGGIIRASELKNGLLLLFMICALLFNNLSLTIND